MVHQEQPVKKSEQSFDTHLTNTGLPILTFKINNTPHFFIADTGANTSLIRKSVVEKQGISVIKDENTVISGLEGSKIEVAECFLRFNDCKSKEYLERFAITEDDSIFEMMQEQHNTVIHGILGNTFFSKYKYIIDYSTNTFYQKNMSQVCIMEISTGRNIITDLPRNNMNLEEVMQFVCNYLDTKNTDDFMFVSGKLEAFKL